MTTTRRQFVAGTLAGVPALVLAPDGLARQARPATPVGDAVWEQIRWELSRVYDELRKGVARADSLRAFESALRMHAAHASATRFDAALARALGARLDRNGRPALIEEVARRSRSHDHRRDVEMLRAFPNYRPDPRVPHQPFTAAEVDTAIDVVAAGKASRTLLVAADELRRRVEQLVARQTEAVNHRRVRQDDCWALQQAIRAMEALTGLVCALAVLQPELMPACVVSAFEVAMLQLTYWIMCEAVF